MTRRSRLFRVALVFGLVVVVGVMAMPGRLWVGQRNDIAQAQDQLAELKVEHRRLQERVNTLSSASLIEQEARASFGWVHPGDETYNIPPAPPLKVELPGVWPFRELQDPLAEVAANP